MPLCIHLILSFCPLKFHRILQLLVTRFRKYSGRRNFRPEGGMATESVKYGRVFLFKFCLQLFFFGFLPFCLFSVFFLVSRPNGPSKSRPKAKSDQLVVKYGNAVDQGN